MSEPQRVVAGPSRMNNPNQPRPGDGRSAQRKPAPSPLQVTQISTPTTDTFVHDPSGDLGSPNSMRGGSAPSHSPRSPIYNVSIPRDGMKSPRERLEAFFKTTDNTDYSQPRSPGTSKSSPLSTPKEDTYRPIRNVSAPLATTNAGGELPRNVPSDPPPKILRPEPRIIPRQSSIDSTMSSVSSTTSYSNLQDPLSPNPSDIAYIISAAGSAEAAIHQLLKEKKQSAAQSAQLWRLVNKQRTLVLGLNKDLERALLDKERYRKKLREQQAQVQPAPVNVIETLQDSPPPRSPSPAGSESPDELPIQRHSVHPDIPNHFQEMERTPDHANQFISSPTASSTSTPSLLALSEGRRTPLPNSANVSPAIRDMEIQNKEPLLETSAVKSNIQALKPLEIQKTPSTSLFVKSSPITPDNDSSGARGSFTARRSITTPRKAPQGPLIELTASTPRAEDFVASSPSTRRGPPAPLNLRPKVPTNSNLGAFGPDDHSGSEYEEVSDVEEIPAFERGRKKTREDDDREREAAVLLKEQQSRSTSKKEKRSKSATIKSSQVTITPTKDMPISPAIRSFSPDENTAGSSSSSMQRHLSPPTSLAGVLNRPPSSADSRSVTTRNLVSQFPLSPGLPISPRPIDRPVNSPSPRSPREGAHVHLVSPPLSPRSSPPMSLSPRAPRNEIPLPPYTPTSLVSPLPLNSLEPEQAALENSEAAIRSPREVQGVFSGLPSDPPSHLLSDQTGPGGVNKGLVSEAYPDLLLPPNALPSILVSVTSSRLKPSRYSTLALRGTEEEPVFTLGISARSNMQQLWRVEKPTVSLPQLDHQLKQLSSFNAKLPDRSLFSGHAPARIDARRIALEKYFEAILDTPMDEKAALIICQYLSTQVIHIEEFEKSGMVGGVEAQPTLKLGLDGRIVKEGFLTKRGKNFGGWKARFFVLDEPALRYYESPGGHLLGTIKLADAQIGRQSVQHSSHSPSRGGDDTNNQVRHAFLILEPKRKDSNNYIRHVLCAESDAERDEWVEALLHYVTGQSVDASRIRPSAVKSDSSSSKVSGSQSRRKDSEAEGIESEETDALQALSYADTIPGQAPVRNLGDRPNLEPSSPVVGTSSQNSLKVISGPTNGTVIQDAGAWGNKLPESPKSKEREMKKRSIWGFREKVSSDGITNHSNDSNTDLSRINAEKPTNVRPVFGIPLQEAADFCMASGTDVYLPAVVFRCLDYLEAKGASSEEGIFRLSGSNVVIKALRERFNVEGDIDLLAQGQYYDVHAVASLLKLYLRELPTTVLTRELHLDFLQVLELEDKPSKIESYNVLVHKLPLANWTLVRALSAFLISIVNRSHINKMSVRNVGIVFSPTLNIPAPVISAFLTDFDAIFAKEPDKTKPASIEVTAPSPLTPEDIRSPRRQLFSDIPTPSFNQASFSNGSGLGVTYEDVIQQSHAEPATGFIPLQPSYSSSNRAPSPNSHPRMAVTVPGPEYGAFKRTIGDTALMRDAKARRRESSMLMMSVGQAHRKSSMPILNIDSGSSDLSLGVSTGTGH
ncbi:hypothetical protein MMC27_001025 [Xylographa pallens]|nr:hypothetical protein [Xylographa pallens]